ncbi:TPA: hypothetical protein I8636_000423 [Morganella morganii]|nr:hypothetical protein [Morganella morganii]HAT3834033.1 hypothetical protein [Morganella morganii]
MAEGARLESVYARKCIEGSNPSLTAILREEPAEQSAGFFRFCFFFFMLLSGPAAEYPVLLHLNFFIFLILF